MASVASLVALLIIFTFAVVDGLTAVPLPAPTIPAAATTSLATAFNPENNLSYSLALWGNVQHLVTIDLAGNIVDLGTTPAMTPLSGHMALDSNANRLAYVAGTAGSLQIVVTNFNRAPLNFLPIQIPDANIISFSNIAFDTQTGLLLVLARNAGLSPPVEQLLAIDVASASTSGAASYQTLGNIPDISMVWPASCSIDSLRGNIAVVGTQTPRGPLGIFVVGYRQPSQNNSLFTTFIPNLPGYSYSGLVLNPSDGLLYTYAKNGTASFLLTIDPLTQHSNLTAVATNSTDAVILNSGVIDEASNAYIYAAAQPRVPGFTRMRIEFGSTCSAGYWSTGNATACEPCPAGTQTQYANRTSAASCVPCPAGTYAATPGSGNCVSCPSLQTSAQGAAACSINVTSVAVLMTVVLVSVVLLVLLFVCALPVLMRRRRARKQSLPIHQHERVQNPLPAAQNPASVNPLYAIRQNSHYESVVSPESVTTTASSETSQ